MDRNGSEQKASARSRAKGSNASPLSSCSLPDAIAAVKVSWVGKAQLTPETVKLYSDLVSRFAAFAVASGASKADEVGGKMVRAFMDARTVSGNLPTASTRHMRVQAVRSFYKEARRLGMATGDPTTDISMSRLPATATRPLTDEEIALCRHYALDSATSLRRPLAWALGEAGGRPIDAEVLRVADVDLDAGLVSFPGTEKYGARHVPLTDWGLKQITRRVAGKRKPSPDELLGAWNRMDIRQPRTAVSMATIETLRAAGLHEEDAVRPHSAGLWRGTRWLKEGKTIDEVAWLLGYRNLDTAAEALGFEWWHR